MKSIEEVTAEMYKMSSEITAWGAGVNEDTDPDAGMLKRNKTKLYTLGLFAGAGTLFYLAGWLTLARICGILIFIQLFTNVVQGVGRWLKK